MPERAVPRPTARLKRIMGHDALDVELDGGAECGEQHPVLSGFAGEAFMDGFRGAHVRNTASGDWLEEGGA